MPDPAPAAPILPLLAPQPPATTSAASAPAAATGASRAGALALDVTFVALTVAVGGGAGRQAELVDRLGRDERHQPVRAGLDLHLRDHVAAYDAGDDARERCCGRTARSPRRRPGSPATSTASAARSAPSTTADAVDRAGGEPAGVGPAPQGVVADPEQRGRCGQPERARLRWHGADCNRDCGRLTPQQHRTCEMTGGGAPGSGRPWHSGAHERHRADGDAQPPLRPGGGHPGGAAAGRA